MDIRVCTRIGNMKYAIRNIATAAHELEQAGRRVLYLNIGDPLLFDFATPPALVEAVAKAMVDGHNGYAPSYGIPVARQAVADQLCGDGAPTLPENVFITSGASEGIEIALTALLEPGENVLTPVPGYPLYSAILTKLSAEERGYRLDPGENWYPDPEHIESLIDERTRAIVLINPNNPTGAVYPPEVLASILDLARERNLVVLADEVYRGLAFDEMPPRIASLANGAKVIAFGSMSKEFLAPGWRVGWLSLHGSNLEINFRTAIMRLMDARLCSPTPPQFALPVALRRGREALHPVLLEIRRRRDEIVRRLTRIPEISCSTPQAAFYILPHFAGLGGSTDEEFVLDLLRSEGVLAVHGSGFGLEPTAGFFRLTYLPNTEVIGAALDGIERIVDRWMCREELAVG